MGYSPWGRKESDMTEWLTLSLSFLILGEFGTIIYNLHFTYYFNGFRVMRRIAETCPIVLS